MRLTLKCKRGDGIYNVRSKWDEKEKRRISVVQCTKFVCYLVYPEESPRILYKCTANEHWYDIKNLYPTREKALKAIEKGAVGE